MTKAEEAVLETVAKYFASSSYERRADYLARELLDSAKELVRERTHPEAVEAVRQAYFREWTAERDRSELVARLKFPQALIEGQDGLIVKQWFDEWESQRKGRESG